MFSYVIKDVKGLVQKIPVPSDGKELQSLKKQVFDFGTQWVYYLDWKLYMSKELYWFEKNWGFQMLASILLPN